MRVHLLLVPYDSAHRGRRMGAGPECLAPALAERLERAGHAVTREVVEIPERVWPAEVGGAFALARRLAELARAARADGAFPVVLSGNCMATLGVVGALGAGARVAWFDAHGDFNTPETTTGGFLDGMALATLVGRCWTVIARTVPGFVPVAERDVRLLGARDLDPLEEEALRDSGVRMVPAAEVGERAAAALAERAAREGVRQLHVHLDLDVLDPAEGRANALAVPGGGSLDALGALLGALAARAPVAALTLSAYDPACDADGRVARAATTAAATLAAALTGSRPAARPA